MKLSVVISAFNEEEKIEDALKSASFADEIIFVDNTSSDKTLEIAKKYTQKVFVRPNNLMLNVNKNFGFTKVSGDWIFSLDADERISQELQKEIRNIMEGRGSADGYWIPRKNIIFGKWIEHTGWYPDSQLRLFRKNRGKFPERHVHEMLKVTGKTENLNGHLIHYNYENIDQFLRKTEIYIESESKDLISKKYVISPIDSIRFPLKEFISRFFAREGYKDGLHGFILSLLMAFYHLGVFVKLWEKQGFKETSSESLTKDLKGEFKGIKKELRYWIITMFMHQTKNPFKKIGYRFARKFGK